MLRKKLTVALVAVAGFAPVWAASCGEGVTKAEAAIPWCCDIGDYVCPPAGVSILYNNLRCRKSITYVQGSTHGVVPPPPNQAVTFEAKAQSRLDVGCCPRVRRGRSGTFEVDR